MGEISSGSDLFNELAHEFAERYRRGERPSLHEYTERYPELADEIRELFPMLAMMERAGSETDGPRGPAAEPPRRDAAIPERLGDYRILREIGRGGMGVVYEAVQESLGRHVALKVLSPDRSAGPVAVIRFRREAKTAALLHHTNIVPVFGVGEHEGVPYYAMQYIRGRGLDSVLREVAAMRRGYGAREEADSLPAGLATGLVTGRYSDLSVAIGAAGGVPPSTSEPDRSRKDPATAVTGAGGAGAERPSSDSSLLRSAESRYYREVARMARQAAEALAYAHAHGVVHRDIKPSNLLLDVQGTVWVTDFGLAKAEDSDELTRPGDVVGTLRYLAPERFVGKADARSDIYGLGMTLYEMLALEPAFRASHRVRLMHAILHEEPRRPRELDPGIPRDLETIVLKAIAKDPADRFADAGALAAELGRFLEGRPIRSRRLSVAERLWRWSRRNPALAALSLVASILTTTLVIGAVAAAWIYREQRDAVTRAQGETAANLVRAVTAERDSRAELGRSLLQQARAERLSGRAGRRDAALEALARAARVAREDDAPPEDLARLRDEVIAALALDDVRPERSWSAPDPDPRRTAFAVEADRYVLVGADGTIHVHRLSDRSEIRVVGAGRPSAREWPVLSADGRFLIIWSSLKEIESSPKKIDLWDLERGEVPAGWPADACAAAFRADGRQVAAVGYEGALRLYDLPAMTEAARSRLAFHSTDLLLNGWVVLSGDGRRLAATGKPWPGVAVFDTASGRLLLKWPVPVPRGQGAVALDHAGTLLAFAYDQAITTFNVADGAVVARLQGHEAGGVSPDFQPGGGLLATTGSDGTTRLWDPIRGRLLTTLPGGGWAGWHRDGTRLAISRNRALTTYRLAGGVERRTIDGRMPGDRADEAHPGPARAAFGPDGRLLALALRPGGVRIVRTSDGAGLAHLPIGGCDEVLFLPDGALLTVNAQGLCRWSIRGGIGATPRIGPPEPLSPIERAVPDISSSLAADAGGHLVGTTARVQRVPLLIDPDRPRRRTWLLPQPDRVIVDLAISPDGRWAAAAGWGDGPSGRSVGVWDVARVKMVAQLPVGPARVAFSPDGRWLGAGGPGRYRFYRAGTWARVSEVEHGQEYGLRPLAFHPGGRIAAILDATGSIVRLVEVETGRALAALDAPEQMVMYGLSFSPDGRHLAVAQDDQRVHLWDLAAIRRRLDELGLAAGLPDLFGDGTTLAGAAGDPDVGRIEVVGADPAGLRWLAIRWALREAWFAFRVLLDPDLADSRELFLRGDRWARMGQWRLAAADYARAFAGELSDDPVRRFQHVALLAAAGDAAGYRSACDQMLAVLGKTDGREWLEYGAHAWAIAPEGPAAIAQALRLAERRAAAHHFRWSDHVLGLARYRAGLLAEADAGLRAGLDRDPGWDHEVLDWLVIAMAQKQLGRPHESRRWLGRAETWVSARLRGRPGGLDRAVPENWHWRDGILLHLLLREARALIGQALPVDRSGP